MEKTGGHLINESTGAQEGNYILSSSPHSHTGFLVIAAKSSMGREEWEAMTRPRQGPLSWWKTRVGWWFGCPAQQMVMLAGSQQ